MTKERLTAKQESYAERLADPKEQRSQAEIAEDLGVTRKTLYEWRKHPLFWPRVREIIDEHSDSSLAKVWNALIFKAVRGDVQAMKLFFQMRGEFTEKQEQRHSFEGGAPVVVFPGADED